MNVFKERSTGLISGALLGFVFFFSAIFSAAAIAQDDGRIAGVVTRSGSGFVEGVLVRIQGTDIEAYTDSNGRFALRGVEPGEYKLEFKYFGFDDLVKDVAVAPGESVELSATLGEGLVLEEEDLVVIGDRTLALNAERAFVGKKSVVLAEKIGQFPDFNAAEALQRLTGVHVDNDRGEGRFVSIRGAPSSFNRVKLNGLSLGSPESNGLGVPLDVFPASQLAKIEVTKSATPAQDANSIGGEINLSFPTAFGSDPRTFLKFSLGQTELDSGNRQGLNGLHSQTFGNNDQFGITITAQYDKRDIKAETIETDGWEDVDNDGDDIDNQFSVEETELRNMEVERENQGFSTVFEWKPVESTRLYTSASINEFDETEWRHRFVTTFGRADTVEDVTVVDAGDGSRTVQDANFIEMDRLFRDQQLDFTPQKFTVFAIGGETLLDDWEFKYQWGRSETEELRKREVVEFRQGSSDTDQPDFDATYTSSGSVLTPRITHGAGSGAFDPASYGFRRIRDRQNFRFDDVDTLSADVTRFLEFGGDKKLDVQFGFRLTTRERRNDENDLEFSAEDAGLTLADFAGDEIGNIVDDIYRFGPRIPGSTFSEIRARSDLDDDTDPEDDLLDDYDASVDVLGYYIQGTYSWSDFAILAGVRVEETELSIDGYSVINEDLPGGSEDPVRQSFESDYNDTFPALHFRWDISDELVFRTAWTNSIRRPNFNDLAPAREVDLDEGDDDTIGTADDVIEIEQGNPQLLPFESENIDISLDWYSDKYGAFSIGYFTKDIENFISEQTDRLSSFDGFTGNIELERPINLEKGSIDGFEFSWTKQFESGIGVDFNYTIVDSEVEFPSEGADARTGGETKLPLEGQADSTGNLALSYSRDKLYTQIAYKRTDSFIAGYDDTFLDEVEGVRENIDLKAIYQFSDTYELELLVRNITDEEKTTFVGTGETRLREFEKNGRWVQASFKINFQ